MDVATPWVMVGVVVVETLAEAAAELVSGALGGEVTGEAELCGLLAPPTRPVR